MEYETFRIREWDVERAHPFHFNNGVSHVLNATFFNVSTFDNLFEREQK